jgi:hypothetical protein
MATPFKKSRLVIGRSMPSARSNWGSFFMIPWGLGCFEDPASYRAAKALASILELYIMTVSWLHIQVTS